MRALFFIALAAGWVSTACAQTPSSAPLAAPGGITRLCCVITSGAIPAGNTVVNTAAETPFATQYVQPANTMQVGQVYDLEGWGTYKVPVGNTVSTEARVRLVGASSYLLADTGPLTNPAGSVGGAQYGYHFKLKVLVLAIGTSGSIIASGTITFSAGATSLDAELPSPGAGANGAVAVDTTQALTWRASAQFGAAQANVSNTLVNLTLDRSMPIQ